MVSTAARPAGMRAPRRGLIYFFGALGGFLFGYESGLIAGAKEFVEREFTPTAAQLGLVVSGLSMGAALGAYASGRLADRFGRRVVIFGLGLIFIVGSLACALAPGTWTLFAARVFLGLAVGGASALVPVYLSEMAPPAQRGTLAGLNQLMIVTGLLLGYLTNFVLHSSENWRLMLGLGAAPAVLLILGLPLLPESPRWLILRGRESEARQLLAATRTPAEVEADVAAVRTLAQERVSVRDVFAPWMRPALVAGLGIALFSQLVGINTVTYYAPEIFRAAGVASGQALLQTIIIGLVKVVFVLVGLALVDRIGRRRLLLAGNVVMALSLVWLSVEAAGLGTGSTASLTISMGLFFVGFSVGWGPVIWVLLGEIFPLGVRGAAIGVASTMVWASTVLVTFTFPVMLASLGLATSMLVFAGLNLVALAFCARFVTETKGKTLEQIEADLRARSTAHTGTTGTAV